MSENKLRKFMKKVNDKFQHKLFEPDNIDFKKLRLYNVAYHMSIYNKGLDRLHTIKVSEIEALEKKYKRQFTCMEDDQNLRTAKCGDLWAIKGLIKKCPKEKAKGDEALADCSVSLFERMMEDLQFNDFKKLIGEDNLYIYGSIDGFREKSEILNDTLYSNTIGKIGSKQWNGPLEVVRDLLGLSGGEFSGRWIRKGL